MSSSHRDQPRRRLAAIVAEHLVDADEATRRVVTAVAGLLARVAYADGDYSAHEEQALRRELGRVHGLTQAGITAICALLADDIAQVVLVGDHDWTRDLREFTTSEVRLEVLDVCVEMAAADHTITYAETVQLRRIATALNLSQDDYHALQAKHRDKLAALQKD